MFPVCDTIPRFLSFCMDIWGGGENLFLCLLGKWTYSYPAALPMSPASPFIGGTPCPAAACPLPADRLQKNTPARAFFICSPSPVSGFRSPRPAPHTPPRFPPAAALLLAAISLNTYLANRKFTHYRSFATSSGYSASILYPHLSPPRL